MPQIPSLTTPILTFVPLKTLYRPLPYIALSPIQLSLCLFAFFYYLRPSEPFLVEYLLIKGGKDAKNLTLNDVLHRIFPLWTYSYPFFQLLVGLVSDTIIPLKLLIILGLISAILSAMLVIFPVNSIVPPQISQFTIALAISCHQAYFALVYHVSFKKDYQRITSLSRFHYLLGHTIGAVIGQVWWIIWYARDGLRRESNPQRLVDLFFATIFCSFICIVVAYVFFPGSPKEYLDNEQNDNCGERSEEEDSLEARPHADLLSDGPESSPDDDPKQSPSNTKIHRQLTLITNLPSTPQSTEMDSLLGTPISNVPSSSIQEPSPLLQPVQTPSIISRILSFFSQILHAYTISNVVFWSLFNIVSIAIHQLSITYYQTLFKKIDPSISFNGFVIAVAYIIAAFTILIPTRFDYIFKKRQSVLLQQTCVLLTLLMSLFLFALSQLNGVIVEMRPALRLLIAYGVFVLYHCVFEFLHVIASAQIASSMQYARFTAVFSLNSVLQNLCQMLIQFVIGTSVLGLDAFKQYLMFGGLLFGLAIVLYAFVGINYVREKWKGAKG